MEQLPSSVPKVTELASGGIDRDPILEELQGLTTAELMELYGSIDQSTGEAFYRNLCTADRPHVATEQEAVLERLAWLSVLHTIDNDEALGHQLLPPWPTRGGLTLFRIALRGVDDGSIRVPESRRQLWLEHASLAAGQLSASDRGLTEVALQLSRMPLGLRDVEGGGGDGFGQLGRRAFEAVLRELVHHIDFPMSKRCFEELLAAGAIVPSHLPQIWETLRAEAVNNHGKGEEELVVGTVEQLAAYVRATALLDGVEAARQKHVAIAAQLVEPALGYFQGLLDPAYTTQS